MIKIILKNKECKSVVHISIMTTSQNVMQHQSRGITNKRQRRTKIKTPGRPEQPRLPADQGFCSPANQAHTCPQSPAADRERLKAREREQACQHHRAGPRPTRVVTHSTLKQPHRDQSPVIQLSL